MTRFWLTTRLALVLAPLAVLVGGVYLGASVPHAAVIAGAALAAVWIGLVKS